MKVANRNTPPRTDTALQTRLGAAIREFRGKLDITQEELAWRAGMHRTYIADIERGTRNITLRSVAGLARALDVSLWDLLAHACLSDRRGTTAMRDALEEILVVEDNPNDVELTLQAFDRAKFTNPVRVISDGAEALDYLFCQGSYVERRREWRPQVVLLDLNLPKVSGMDVLRRMKADKRTASIPVVVLTVSQSDSNIAECKRLGAAAYIVKPVGFENFCQVTSELSFNWALIKPAAVATSPGTHAA